MTFIPIPPTSDPEVKRNVYVYTPTRISYQMKSTSIGNSFFFCSYSPLPPPSRVRVTSAKSKVFWRLLSSAKTKNEPHGRTRDRNGNRVQTREWAIRARDEYQKPSVVLHSKEVVVGRNGRVIQSLVWPRQVIYIHGRTRMVVLIVCTYTFYSSPICTCTIRPDCFNINI